jgi:hypothetical protein
MTILFIVIIAEQFNNVEIRGWLCARRRFFWPRSGTICGGLDGSSFPAGVSFQQ